MTQGQTVYVQWYDKLLQGTVVQNTTPDDPLLGCMVAVSIPIQDTMATALFMPEHVYGSVQEACGEYPKTFPTPESFRHPDLPISIYETVSDAIAKALEAQKHTVCENKQPVYKREQPVYENEQYASEGKQPAYSIMRFKEEHWDHQHNHIKVEALDEYYQLWRNTHHATPTPPATLPPTPPSRIDEAVPQNETTCKPIKSVTQLSLFD